MEWDACVEWEPCEEWFATTFPPVWLMPDIVARDGRMLSDAAATREAAVASLFLSKNADSSFKRSLSFFFFLEPSFFRFSGDIKTNRDESI